MRYKDLSPLLYDKLPEVYRKADAHPEINYTLKRYLDALFLGGLNPLHKDIIKLYNVLDVETCPTEVLPLLSKLLGYNYINEVDEKTQRKIIANIIELYKKKGTNSVLEFITREFTQFDSKVVELQYRIFKTWSPDPKGIPSSQYKEPRTLSNKGVTSDTHHLFSEKGKYNRKGVLVELDGKESQLMLLNRLLVEFLPVYCDLYISIKTKEAYTDTAFLTGTEELKSPLLRDVENAKTKVTPKNTYSIKEGTMQDETSLTFGDEKTKMSNKIKTTDEVHIKSSEKHKLSTSLHYEESANIKSSENKESIKQESAIIQEKVKISVIEKNKSNITFKAEKVNVNTEPTETLTYKFKEKPMNYELQIPVEEEHLDPQPEPPVQE